MSAKRFLEISFKIQNSETIRSNSVASHLAMFLLPFPNKWEELKIMIIQNTMPWLCARKNRELDFFGHHHDPRSHNFISVIICDVQRSIAELTNLASLQLYGYFSAISYNVQCCTTLLSLWIWFANCLDLALLWSLVRMQNCKSHVKTKNVYIFIDFTIMLTHRNMFQYTCRPNHYIGYLQSSSYLKTTSN